MIYHVTHQTAWLQQAGSDLFEPESLKTEGFVHCCTREQLEGVLSRYFAGQSELLLLHLDEMRLPYLKYEMATGGESFPHLYGPIPKQAIVRMEPIGTE